MKLLTAVRIGSLQLKNRVVLPPMVRNYAQDGHVTERTRAHYRRIASGEAGLLIVEAASIDSHCNLIFPGQLVIDNDTYIPGFEDLAKAIHDEGSRAVLQLHHGGTHARRDLIPGDIVGPSPDPHVKHEIRVLDHTGIAEVVQKHASAASRAKRAGFDGIEVIAGHGYLINQFLSRAWNKRRDSYGGSLENRARMLLEIVEAIRKEVGSDYPFMCRINCEESGLEDSNSVDDAVRIAVMLQDAGVDAIHVSGLNEIRSYYSPLGYFEYGTAQIKEAVDIPVIASGGLDTVIAEKMLQANKADLVSFGRRLLADPDIPRKLASDEANEIRPCIMCAHCSDCLNRDDGPVGCAINPETGWEFERHIVPSAARKTIAVVGGGPGGMEAARVAALRGHDVHLFEREPELGGLLNLASLPPGKDVLDRFRQFQVSQLVRTGVHIRTGTEADAAGLKELSPDAVVIATGSKAVYPRVANLESPNVATYSDVLQGKVETGDTVVVVGGGRSGCETADFLVKRDRQVTIVEMLQALMNEAKPSRSKQILVDELAKDGVEILVNTRAEKPVSEGLEVATEDGSRKVLIADTVVLAAGLEPDTALYEQVRDVFPAVYRIGDCVDCGLVKDAIHQAYEVASSL